MATLLITVVLVAYLAAVVWAAIDAARRPRPEWGGRSKGLWIALLVVGGYLGADLFLVPVYFMVVRPTQDAG